MLYASESELTFACRILEKSYIFTAFYRISELRSREDLIKGIVENLDYSVYILNYSLLGPRSFILAGTAMHG